MVAATQPSPLKPVFAKEELEVISTLKFQIKGLFIF
jgi:hypothetical protein